MDCKANEKRGEEKGARGKEKRVKRDKKGGREEKEGKDLRKMKKRRKLQVSMGKIRLLQQKIRFHHILYSHVCLLHGSNTPRMFTDPIPLTTNSVLLRHVFFEIFQIPQTIYSLVTVKNSY